MSDPAPPDDDEPFADLGDIEDLDDEELASLEAAFTEMDVAEIDDDAVWEALVEIEAETDGTSTAGDGPADADAAAASAVVPKRRYCERCEYFSPPPEVACGNEGTRIAALVGVDHFRVVDCPVVADRRGTDEPADLDE